VVTLWCQVASLVRWEAPNYAMIQALGRILCDPVIDFRDLEVLMGFHGWRL
jgi:hypothetical protein